MVVMKPCSMPKDWCMICAIGARQLVVHEPFETTTCSLSSLSSLMPKTTVRSAPSAGAETSTRLAPAVRCAEAVFFEVKMPVHSRAMSMPIALCGSFDGSRSQVTFILPRPTSIVSPSIFTSWGKRPCTESKRNRWALVSTGPRSLIATTSTSLRPDSTMARRTLRPMRPKPLIATRTAMSSSVISEPARRLGDRLGRDAEMLEKIGGLARAAEALHADERAAHAEPALPAEARGRLAGDADRAVGPQDLLPICIVLSGKQLPGGHGHNAGRNAVLGEKFAGGDSQMNFGARRDQPNVGRCIARQDVGAAPAQVAFAGVTHRRHVLARERDDARRVP